MIEIKELTAHQTGEQFKRAFTRAKDQWDALKKELEKNNKKSEKLEEDRFLLQEKIENIEDEIESLRKSYEEFCKETGIEYNLK